MGAGPWERGHGSGRGQISVGDVWRDWEGERTLH